MFSALFLVCGVATAQDGLRTDGVVPAPGQGEAGLVVTRAIALGAGGTDGAFGLYGSMGVGQDVGLGLTLAWGDGGVIGGELRGQLPLLGRRDAPVLSLLFGVDAAAPVMALNEIPPWWAEGGLMAGTTLARDLRLYGGAVVNWRVEAGADGLWYEPTVGLSWRPALGERLSAVIAVEAAGSTDLEMVEIGPALVLGVAGR